MGTRQGRTMGGRMAVFMAGLAAAWLSAGVFAQPGDPGDLAKPPPIPPETEGDVPIPPKIQDEQIEPTVTIREEEDRMIEEYRRNGQVYMVKVTPRGGKPYYYIDTDGDGTLELDPKQRALNPVQPVYWKVKEWD
ncbi:MAG: DUF2782 domain-containing protein [Xanthomonadales bacterium]